SHVYHRVLMRSSRPRGSRPCKESSARQTHTGRGHHVGGSSPLTLAPHQKNALLPTRPGPCGKKCAETPRTRYETNTGLFAPGTGRGRRPHKRMTEAIEK